MTNVITLPTRETEEPEDMVWICGHCSQSVFELHLDGTTECRGCGHRGEFPDGVWSDWKPNLAPPTEATRTTTVFDSKEFAQRAITRAIDDDTTVLVVADDSGRIRAWSQYNFESSDAEKATVRYLLAQATGLLLGDPPIERPADALPADDD